MNHCEWRSCNHKSEVATWRRNATDNVHLRWPPADPTDVGQRASCSLAHCRPFPLERLASLMWEECHVTRKRVKVQAAEVGWGFIPGRDGLSGLPTDEKTGLKWVRRG
jgi:hypothetical protein